MGSEREQMDSKARARRKNGQGSGQEQGLGKEPRICGDK